MSDKLKLHRLLDLTIVKTAFVEAFFKLTPARQIHNPVMFTVYVAALLTSGLFLQALFGQGEGPARFILAISLWLWFTVFFSNFAES